MFPMRAPVGAPKRAAWAALAGLALAAALAAAAAPAAEAAPAAARAARAAAAGPAQAAALPGVAGSSPGGGAGPGVVSLDGASGLWFEDLTAEFFGDSSWLWTPLDSKAHTVYVRNDSAHVAWGQARVVISEPAGGLWDAAVVVGGGSPVWVGGPAGGEVVASAVLADVAPGEVTRVDLWVRVDPGNTLSPQTGVGAVIDAEVVLSGGPQDDGGEVPEPAPAPDPESAPPPSPAPSSLLSSPPAVAGVGGLPVTGAQAAGLAGLAAVLLGAGWWLVAAARRRRDQAGGGL
jgi:hypothetical protein